MTQLGACSLSVACWHDYKFTGKERDSESGLDMFGARYYGSSLGRFMTPDWAAKPTDVPYANFGNPQSLNLYSYVENNPTTTGDPDGHCTDPFSCGVEFAGIGTLIEPGGGTVVGAALGGIVGGAIVYFGGKAIINSIHQSENTASKNAPQSGANQEGTQSGDKAVPNPNGSKGAPDHQQTAEEERAKMDGQREVRVPTPEGEKGSRVIDAAKVENGKVTEATQVIRPNKDGTPPAREVRAAADIQKATGVTPKLVPVRPIKKPDGQ